MTKNLQNATKTKLGTELAIRVTRSRSDAWIMSTGNPRAGLPIYDRLR